MEVVSHHLKLTRCYILQTKIVHTLFKRVETFFYYNCQIHFTSNSGIRNTFYIYLYIYLNACHFQCIGYTLAKKTQKQTERKTHNTQGREGGGDCKFTPQTRSKGTPQKTQQKHLVTIYKQQNKRYLQKQGKHWLKMAVIHGQATNKSLYQYAILTPVAVEGCFA